MTFQKDPENYETKYLKKSADFAGKRIVEVGCGEGRLTWRYAGSASFVVGVDSDKDALRVAAYDRPSDLKTKVHFANVAAEYLPFRKEMFDIALLSWSL